MAVSAQEPHTTGWTGWISFASFIIALSGLIHLIYGIGAVMSQDWYLYSSGTVYILDTSAWGWGMIIGGAFMILTALLLASGNMFGRIIGVTLALLSLFANIALLSVTPVWSIIAIALALFIIYAIIAHGDEMKNHPT